MRVSLGMLELTTKDCHRIIVDIPIGDHLWAAQNVGFRALQIGTIVLHVHFV